MIDYKAPGSPMYKNIDKANNALDSYLTNLFLDLSEDFLEKPINEPIKELYLQTRQIEKELGPTPEVKAIYDQIISAPQKARLKKTLKLGKYYLLSLAIYSGFLSDKIKNNDNTPMEVIAMIPAIILFTGFYSDMIPRIALNYSGYSESDRDYLLAGVQEELEKIKQKIPIEVYEELENRAKELSAHNLKVLEEKHMQHRIEINSDDKYSEEKEAGDGSVQRR